jgi:predicted DNA-binding transcriptional regulator AlpA
MKFLRFSDLVERRIVSNRVTLGRWIKDQGFPPGILLGPNTRAWEEGAVNAWLASRGASLRSDAQPPAAA